MRLNNPDLKFLLGSANILEISLPIHYKYNEQTEIFCTMVFQEQIIERSDVVLSGQIGYYEPESRAEKQYLKLGVAFKF